MTRRAIRAQPSARADARRRSRSAARGRQRTARLPALLHELHRVRRSASAWAARFALQERFDALVLARGGEQGGCARARCRRRFILLSFAAYRASRHLRATAHRARARGRGERRPSRRDSETFDAWLDRNGQDAQDPPRVLGSLLHSGTQRAVRQSERGGRAVRALHGVPERCRRRALRFLDRSARARRRGRGRRVSTRCTFPRPFSA